MPEMTTDAMATDSASRSLGDPPQELELHLRIRDPEVIGELLRQGIPEAREHHALAALRLGVLALRQASGMIDTAAIRQAGTDMLENLRGVLNEHATLVTTGISNDLRVYFDPNTGHLPNRLDRLTKKDSDLDGFLRGHLDGETSTVARTLAKQVGESSPLYKLLSPTEQDGLVASLQETIQAALDQQRDAVLAEFSLDKPESALSRLVANISETNDEFSEKLSGDIDRVSKEFSLDNENGALRRLVGRVEQAQRTITDEFSLDNKASGLNKLMTVVNALGESNKDFHNEVRRTLEVLLGKKAEAERGTRGGVDFEGCVCAWMQRECEGLGDVFEPVGNTAGEIRGSKVGDGVIVLGEDCAAAGARLVIEAKEKDGYTLAKALDELKTARQNRKAGLGLFVFSRKKCPENIASLQRHGSDVIVVWDDEDTASDVVLRAGLSVVRALAVRERLESEVQAEDLGAVEVAVRTIETAMARLDEVKTWAGTIRNNGQKIEEAVVKAMNALKPQIEVLDEHVQRLRRVG